MRLHIDQPPCPRDRRVIRRLLVKPDSQKPPQPERIRRSPSDPALRIDSFKIPNQQQPEIDSRHQRWPPVVCGVKLRALLLGECIELPLFQQFIHSLVEPMAWPLRQLIVADPQLLLPLSAPSCPHRHRDFSRLQWHSTRTSDLRKSCSATNKQKTDFHHGLLGATCGHVQGSATPAGVLYVSQPEVSNSYIKQIFNYALKVAERGAECGPSSI